jgi:hypothetical protein
LETAVQTAGITQFKLHQEQQIETRMITGSHLTRWFDDKGYNGRSSYQMRLKTGGLTDDDIQAVYRRYQTQLAGQPVHWKTSYVYISLTF